MQLKNKQNFINGLMLDPARVPLQFEWYERFIPWMAKWGYNTLILNLADDTGCAVKLKCHPELSSSAALTHAQIKRLRSLADTCNMTIVPLIATLGHTGYIYFRDRYRHLGDGLNEPGRNALCLARSESKKILAEILEEVMTLFPGDYLHVGLDEAGDLPKKTCRHCRREFAGMSEPEIVVRHLKWLHTLAKRRNRQVMFWGMERLHKERDTVIAQSAPASAISCVWIYNGDEAYLTDKEIKFHIRHKRPVIGVPALICWPNTTVIPNRDNLTNIRRFAEIIHRNSKHPEVRGIINSVWQHTYTLPGTLIYGMAYAADQFAGSGGSRDFAGMFAREFFGLPRRSPVGRLLRDLHDCAPMFRDMPNLIECIKPEDIKAVTPKERRIALRMGDKARKIAGGLRAEQRYVLQNRDIYDAYVLAADIFVHIGERAALLEHARPPRAALRKLARRARELADAAWNNWDTTLATGHPCRKMRAPPANQSSAEVNIDRYCYFGNSKKHSNKNIFLSLERSAVFLEKCGKGL